MKKSSIFKLSLVLLVVFFAVFLSLKKKYDAQGNVKTAFPDIVSELKNIDKIIIQDANSQQSISKETNKWYLDNYNKYPVDIGKVNNFFLNLSNSIFIDKRDTSLAGIKKLGLDNSFSEQTS